MIKPFETSVTNYRVYCDECGEVFGRSEHNANGHSFSLTAVARAEAMKQNWVSFGKIWICPKHPILITPFQYEYAASKAGHL